MEHARPLARQDNFHAATSPQDTDQSLSTTQAGLQDDQTDAKKQIERLERPNQGPSEVAAQELQVYPTDNTQLITSDCDSYLLHDRRPQLVRVATGTSEFAGQALQAYRADTKEQNERLERVASGAMVAILQAADRVSENTQGALNVASAAIDVARQGTENMKEVALDAHSLTRDLIQRTSDERKSQSEEERKRRRDEQIGALIQQLGAWRILLQPDIPKEAMVGFAQSQIYTLTRMLEFLESQKQTEKLLEEANRRQVESTLHSRTAKINLAKKEIEQSRPSFDNNGLYLPLLLNCALVVCCASYYFGGLKTASIAIMAVAGGGIYRTASYFIDLSNRRKWLGIYIKALDRLLQDPELKVRSTVQKVLNDDLSIGNIQKESYCTINILEKIEDKPVTGNPAETVPMIPSELEFLVDHATHQPVKSFPKL